MPMPNLDKIIQFLQKHASDGIREMASGKYATHSFNVISNAGRSSTFLMIFLPSRSDRAIYNALKPVIDGEYGEGTLVRPNPLAAGKDS
jgi:hypothetical protein